MARLAGEDDEVDPAHEQCPQDKGHEQAEAECEWPEFHGMVALMSMFLAISGQSLVSAVIWIIVTGLIFWLLTYLLDYLKIPEPFNKVARVVLVITAVLILINALLSLAGVKLVQW